MPDISPKLDMEIGRIATALEGINYSLGVLASGLTVPGKSAGGGRPLHDQATSVAKLLERIAVALEGTKGK